MSPELDGGYSMHSLLKSFEVNVIHRHEENCKKSRGFTRFDVDTIGKQQAEDTPKR